MLEVNDPKLEAHLLTEKNCVGPDVRKDEAKSVAVCDRDETDSPQFRSVFIICPVQGKGFTKIGVQIGLTAPRST